MRKSHWLRWACLFAMLALIVCAAVACGNSDTPATTTPSGNENVPSDALANKIKNWTIVYPDNTSKEIAQKVTALENAINAASGGSVGVKTDYVRRGEIPKDAKEILVGTTNRASSLAATEILQTRVSNYYDWYISITEHEIVIDGFSADAIGEAIDYFVANLLKGSPANGYTKKYEHSFAITTYGGVSIEQDRIVKAKEATETESAQALALQKLIREHYGCELAIVTDEETAQDAEFVIGTTSRTVSQNAAKAVYTARTNCAFDYRIAAEKTQIAIYGTARSLADAVSAFGTQYVGEAVKDITAGIDLTYQKPGLHNITISGVGIDRYVFVLPVGSDLDTRSFLLYLQKWILENTGNDLPCVTDATAPQEYEILLGETNRPQSSHTIAKDQYKIHVNGTKLVFDATHYYPLHQALLMFTDQYVRATKDVTFPANFVAEATSDVPITWTDDGSAEALVKVPVKDGTYTLVWNDEFSDMDELNPDKWTCRPHMNPLGTVSLLEPGIVDVKNGELILTARIHDKNGDGVIDDKDWKEGSTENLYDTNLAISTSNTMNYMYGYLEMRGKVPYYGKGEWPSFWMLTGTAQLANAHYKAINKTFSYGIEIDIFEIFSSTTNCTPNLHKWGVQTPNGSQHIQMSGIDQGASISGTRSYEFDDPTGAKAREYHEYGFLWSEHIMAFSIDGQFYYSYDLSKDFDKNYKSGMDDFHQAMHIIFNNMLFPEQYVASESGAWATKIKIQKDLFPVTYTLDYCRLYQIANYGEFYVPQEAGKKELKGGW